MATPTSSFKDTGTIGADVYIRDSEDQTLQMKALVYSINYETQEADIGLYPRRWGKFSMLHLPEVYRVTVPLSELSLEPHSGAQQVGYEDVLLQRPAEASAAVPWMDWVGRMHAPGCADPDVPVAANTTTVGEDGVPEFGPGSVTQIGFGPTPVVIAEPLVGHTGPTKLAPLSPELAAGQPAPVKVESAAEPKGKKGKPPLFSKAEILARITDTEDALKKLRNMIDKVME